jgi:hypothetical protein
MLTPNTLYIRYRNRMGSNRGYKASFSIAPIDVSQRNLKLSNVYGVSRCVRGQHIVYYF